MNILLTYDTLVSLPELLSALGLHISENNELPRSAYQDTVLFSFRNYYELLGRQEWYAYNDYPIVDRKRNIVVSQPFTHTFLPALLVFIERYLIDFEGTPSDMRDMTTIDWREIIFLLKKYPISESIYPLWKECTAEFLRAGYCIHHGELNAPVLVCLSGYEFDRMDQRILKILDVQSKSCHFG